MVRRTRHREGAAGGRGGPRHRGPATRLRQRRLSAYARCARRARASPPARLKAGFFAMLESRAGGRGGPRRRTPAIGRCPSHLFFQRRARAAPPARLTPQCNMATTPHVCRRCGCSKAAAGPHRSSKDRGACTLQLCRAVRRQPMTCDGAGAPALRLLALVH
jgi:hypothetical protein